MLKGSGIAIDATCGNGHDSEFLAQLLKLNCEKYESDSSLIIKQLYCLDIQEDAMKNTSNRLKKVIHPSQWENIHFIHGSHEKFPPLIRENSVSLICYNLGYLPGAQRKTTEAFVQTTTETTKKSLVAAIPLLKEGGLLCVTAYPGNDGGEEEQKVVHDIVCNLSPTDWRVYLHSPINRPQSPHLFMAFRIDKSSRSISKSFV